MHFKSLTKFMFSFQGRIGRSDYWLKWILPATVAFVVPNAISFMVSVSSFDPAAIKQVPIGVGHMIVQWVVLAYSLVIIWAHFAVTSRRWHDRNKSGWMTMILLVMMVPWVLTGGAVLWSLIVLAILLWNLIECGFLKGTDGPNRFGEDPLRTDAAQPAMEPQI